jgi:hypothetical protein
VRGFSAGLAADQADRDGEGRPGKLGTWSGARWRDARDQFVLVEGFGHVVVGADAETLDLVLDAGEAGEDQRRLTRCSGRRMLLTASGAGGVIDQMQRLWH